jgi:hypothetical protein
MPDRRSVPQIPDALRNELIAIFPLYRERVLIEDEAPTFHSVLTDFTPYFGAELASFSVAQLRSLGDLISAAVEAGGTLENAFGTCLLEHLHQIGASKTLRPYLSEQALERRRA